MNNKIRYVIDNLGVYSVVIVKGFTPDNSIGKLQDDYLNEDIPYLQVEFEQQQDGSFKPIFTVDPVKKQQAIDDKFADDLDKEAKKLAKKVFKDAVKAIKKNQLTSLDEITNAIVDLANYINDKDS